MKSKHGVTDANAFDFSKGGNFVMVGSDKSMEDIFLSKDSEDFHYCAQIEALGRYSLENAEEECNKLNGQLGLTAQDKTPGKTAIFIPSIRYISNVRKDYRCRVIFDYSYVNDDEAKRRSEAMNQNLGRRSLTLRFIIPRPKNTSTA